MKINLFQKPGVPFTFSAVICSAIFCFDHRSSKSGSFQKEHVEEPAVVTLATHSSPDRLHWATVQAILWDGPISLSVFTPGYDFVHFALLLDYMFRCFPELEAKAAIHVIYPAGMPPVIPSDADKRSLKVSDLSSLQLRD